MLKTTVPYLMLLLVFGAIKANVADARRSYPSIFQAWNGIENRPDTDELHRLAEHDLAFAHPYALLKIAWNISEEQPYAGLATALNPNQLDTARQRKQELLSLNPNLLLLVEIRYRDARYVSRQNEADVENWWESVISHRILPIGSKVATENRLLGGVKIPTVMERLTKTIKFSVTS